MSNWEFAAFVAAISIGLLGLLAFTLIGTVGSWRLIRQADRTAAAAAEASAAVEELARRLARERDSGATGPGVGAGANVAAFAEQARVLLEQQTRLQDAVHTLVEAGVLDRAGGTRRLEELEDAVRRMEQRLSEMAAAVANLAQRLP